MTVVRLGLAYDGTSFRGWARQPGQRTVAGVLEAALEQVIGEVPRLSVAGRTDAGVHARGQVVSFEADVGELARLQRQLNSMLGPEVVVTEARAAPPDFDARFSATAREYRYRIDTGPFADPFSAQWVWHREGALSVPRMRTAARHLIGEHDFASFCRRPPGGASTMRRLERLSVTRDGERVEISARANAFLHQMVRALVGTLAVVGAGRLEPDAVISILGARDRASSPQMAPAHGLTLERVVYGRRG